MTSGLETPSRTPPARCRSAGRSGIGCGSARSRSQSAPVSAKHDRRENVTEHDVDGHTRGERPERLQAGARELAHARGEPDAEEAEDECPGTEVLDRSHEIRS